MTKIRKFFKLIAILLIIVAFLYYPTNRHAPYLPESQTKEQIYTRIQILQNKESKSFRDIDEFYVLSEIYLNN